VCFMPSLSSPPKKIVGPPVAHLILATWLRSCVYLKCFSAISFIVRFCHSLFLKRFCSYSCFDLLELPEASHSRFSVYSLIEDTMVYVL
jgi:hypothetical protein